MEEVATDTTPVGVHEVLRRPDISAVILVSFVVMIGLGAVFPILPLFARSFGVSYAATGLMMSGFGLTRLGADIAAGSIVDRYGERRMGALGLAWIAVCAGLTAIAPSYPIAVLTWSIGGLGSAVMFAATYGYLLKSVPQPAMARTLGVFYGSFNAGIIAGGVFGGIVAGRFGLAAPLVCYAGLLVLAAAILHLRMPATLPGSRTDGDVPAPAKVRDLLRRRTFVAVLATNFAYLWFVSAVFDTLVPLFGKDELGMSTTAIGSIFAVAIATEFAVLYPAGALADRHGGKAVVVPSLAGLAVAVAILGYMPTALALAMAMGVVGIASGFAGVPPAAMLAEVVPSGSSGLGVGVFRFAGDLAFVIGPTAVAASAGAFGFQSAFVIAALPVAGALGLVATSDFRGRSMTHSSAPRSS